MSGHSHWATTHRQKGLNDAKRGAVFTKVGRNVILAAERGGGNPDTNFSLRLAIEAARAVNMPKENIERAIKRGTGELKDSAKIEEIAYEGFGPGNIALLIETATDNKNRTVGEIKTLLTKNGGKLGAKGTVSFLFRRVGLIAFDAEKCPVTTLENETLESGAEDFFQEENFFTVITSPDQLQRVKQYFESKNLVPETAQLGYLPTQKVALDGPQRESLEKLLGLLEDLGDVQMVWNNLA
ncbi:MAG: YebC/PmpR family DNA-binding transcriptional regulator [Candidatus Moraniibacteriota bacterium]